MDNNSELYVSKMKKWGMYDTLSNMVRERIKQGIIQKGTEEEAIQKYLRAFNLIKVEPEKIIYLYIHPETGREKHIWEKKTE